MGCLRIWCAYCMLKISKSKCIKELRYLPEGKNHTSSQLCLILLVLIHLLQHVLCSVKVKHNYPTLYLLPAEHNYLSVPPSVFNVFCFLSPPVRNWRSLITSSALVSGDTQGRKREKARWDSPDETGWWSSQREEVNLLRGLLLEGSTSERLQRPSSLNFRFHLYKYYDGNSSSANLHALLHPQLKWDRIRAEEC